MFLTLKSRGGGRPGEQGQEGTWSLPWGRSTRPGQQTPLQPLCPHIQLGRVMEQSHGPGTPDPEQPVEVETGQMRMKETEEPLRQLQERCETDEKRGSGHGGVTCVGPGLGDHPLSRANCHVQLGLGRFGAFLGLSAPQQERCSAGPPPVPLQPRGTGEHGHRWLLHPLVPIRLFHGSGCISGPSIGGWGSCPPPRYDALTRSHLGPALLAHTILFGLKGWKGFQIS